MFKRKQNDRKNDTNFVLKSWITCNMDRISTWQDLKADAIFHSTVVYFSYLRNETNY